MYEQMDIATYRPTRPRGADRVGEKYLKVQGIQKVPEGPRSPKVT